MDGQDLRRQRIRPTEAARPIMGWHQRLHWVHIFVIFVIPLFGFINALWTPLTVKTATFAVVYSFFKALGITAGHHRLWAHKSYNATNPLKYFLAAFAAGAGEGAIYTWCQAHRAHHRYCDTEKDPYNARKGLIHAHIGWLVLKPDPTVARTIDLTDLYADEVVMWQKKHHVALFFSMGFIIPTIVAGLGWGDWQGGLIHAGCLGTFFVQQSSFSINSLAHWLGDQPFQSDVSSRDNWLVAIVTLGEGYHNFHHEFPLDYRNGIRWYDMDPTKWMIWSWKTLGLAYDLKQYSDDDIEKSRVMELQKQLDRELAKFD